MELVFIGIVFVALCAVLFVFLWPYSGQNQKFAALAGQMGWNYREGDAADSWFADSGSVLSASAEFLHAEDKLEGQVGEVAFQFVNVSVTRKAHSMTDFFGVVSLKVPGESPHIVVVPHGVDVVSAEELSNDSRLRPAELEGTRTKVFVPEGYEIESLEVLEPDTLMALENARMAVEINGDTASFIAGHTLRAGEVKKLVPAAVSIAAMISGNKVDEGNAAGPDLKVSTVAEYVRAFGGGLGSIVLGVLLLSAIMAAIMAVIWWLHS